MQKWKVYISSFFSSSLIEETKIYNNEKLQPVILAVGAGIGADFDINKIRYAEVKECEWVEETCEICG